MKAKVEQAWIRPGEGGKAYEVVVRVDIVKGKFIESVHAQMDDAQARMKVLLRPDIFVESRDLTPTV